MASPNLSSIRLSVSSQLRLLVGLFSMVFPTISFLPFFSQTRLPFHYLFLHQLVQYLFIYHFFLFDVFSHHIYLHQRSIIFSSQNLSLWLHDDPFPYVPPPPLAPYLHCRFCNIFLQLRPLPPYLPPPYGSVPYAPMSPYSTFPTPSDPSNLLPFPIPRS